MSEREQTGWLKRMISGDASLVQLQGKLESVLADLEDATRELKAERERSALKDQELAGLRDTLETTTVRAEQFKQDLNRVQRELEQSQEQVAAAQTKGDQQRQEFERALGEARGNAERALGEAKAASERSRLLAEAEKLKTKSAYSQVQGLEKRAEALQQQCAARDQELVQVKASLATAESQLVNVGTLREDLKKKSEELVKAKSEWSSQRAGLDATILKQRSRQEEHLQRLAALEADLVEAGEKYKASEEASRTDKQAVIHVRAELERVRKAQEVLVRDERVRWTLLVNRLWKALERSLGKAAAVSLSGALDGDEGLARLSKVNTPEAAGPLLTQTLATLCPGIQTSLSAADGGGYELVLKRPNAAPDACAPGWLGVYAVQCLSSLLGPGLRVANIGQNGAEVTVRARLREQSDVTRLAG